VSLTVKSKPHLVGHKSETNDSVTMKRQKNIAPKVEKVKGQTEVTTDLIFGIEDTGVGIANDEIEILFEPFVQTQSGQESNEGTGLGLSISRSFVELMGGQITVSSIVGVGSIFRFNLPVNCVKLLDTNSHTTDITVTPNLYRVLIVDAEWSNRQLLYKILSPLGFELREASNGLEAVEVSKEWEASLILMDMQISVMDGYEATRNIKASLKGEATTIIAMIGSNSEEEVGLALSCGCDDFVEKPFQEQIILDKILEYLKISNMSEDLTSVSSIVNSTGGSIQLDFLAASLAVMSKEWISQLYEAAELIDNQQIMELISQIPAEQITLIQTLNDGVNNFRCDQIIDLIENTGLLSKDFPKS
ncbi:MAG: response regulator, partial [Microcoleaceae cyanobacterium]